MRGIAISRVGIGILLSLLCLGCSPTKEASPQARPQRDQMRFFERPAALAAVRASGEPVPVLVLIKQDAWLDVLGSDSPMFALYEDGTVIWRKGDGFRTTRLNQSAMERLLAELNPDALRPLYGRYDALQVTDQPEEDLLLYRGERPTFISVYGSLDSSAVRGSTPTAIVSAYDKLKQFNPPQSTDWLPDSIEVMVWPYAYAPEPSIKWPKDLPDLNDPHTLKRGDSFSIYIRSSKLQEVRAFLAHRSEKAAIEIDGKKWMVGIRFPFPTERLWMAPNPEIKAAAN